MSAATLRASWKTQKNNITIANTCRKTNIFICVPCNSTEMSVNQTPYNCLCTLFFYKTWIRLVFHWIKQVYTCSKLGILQSVPHCLWNILLQMVTMVLVTKFPNVLNLIIHSVQYQTILLVKSIELLLNRLTKQFDKASGNLSMCLTSTWSSAKQYYQWRGKEKICSFYLMTTH